MLARKVLNTVPYTFGGVAVAMAGIVALVGLIVPHMVRMIAGPDHRTLLPLSAALGATHLWILTRADYRLPMLVVAVLAALVLFRLVDAALQLR